MDKLSAVIITFNEEKNIARCIDSIQRVADEIVLLDSFSADRTVDIAKSKGAVVYQQPFAGYIEQKNKALELATHRYVLCLDADEAIDAKLEQSILLARQHLNFAGYTMNRCTNYCGRFIRHGSWYPDRKLRLFDKTFARWGGINPHDKVSFLSPSTSQHLAGDILHFSFNSLEEHVTQNNRFSTIAAEAYFKVGRKSGWLKMLVNPSWSFFYSYVLRGGFLDGYYGWVIAKNIAHLTLMKYYKLYALRKRIPVRPPTSD